MSITITTFQNGERIGAATGEIFYQDSKIAKISFCPNSRGVPQDLVVGVENIPEPGMIKVRVAPEKYTVDVYSR